MTAERSKVKDDRQHRFQVLGSRPVRADGTDKVTGRAAYGADIRLPDMLYGKVLRSPHAHAKIRSIDLSKARALRGVRAVITAEDLEIFEDEANQSGQRDIWIGYDRDNLLANEKVLYHGHAVAAVSAIDPHIAQEALALIEIDYEVLPAVMDARQAMNPSAPILLDNLRTDELGKKGDETTNIASHHRYQRGDVSIGFIEAVAIVERNSPRLLSTRDTLNHNPPPLFTQPTTNLQSGAALKARSIPGNRYLIYCISRYQEFVSYLWRLVAPLAVSTEPIWNPWSPCFR